MSLLRLRLTPQIATIQSLAITGGATESIFVEAERFLFQHTDHQKALEYVAQRKRMDRYHSVMDFVFCELNGEWRFACIRYYNGEGPQLRRQITEEQIAEYDRRLVIALKVAHELFCAKRCKNWTSFKFEVRQVLKAA